MDENMSQAISMFGATILFVVSLSCAIFAYNGLNERADSFFAMNTISGRMEDATTTFLDPDELQREVTVAEVYMAILELPKYVSTAGNSGDTVIHIDDSTYSAEVDFNTNITKIKLDGLGGAMVSEYVFDPVADTTSVMNRMLKDFCAIVLGLSLTGDTSNEILRNADCQTAIEATTFSLQYTGNEIIYIKN